MRNEGEARRFFYSKEGRKIVSTFSWVTRNLFLSSRKQKYIFPFQRNAKRIPFFTKREEKNHFSLLKIFTLIVEERETVSLLQEKERKSCFLFFYSTRRTLFLPSKKNRKLKTEKFCSFPRERRKKSFPSSESEIYFFCSCLFFIGKKKLDWTKCGSNQKSDWIIEINDPKNVHSGTSFFFSAKLVEPIQNERSKIWGPNRSRIKNGCNIRDRWPRKPLFLSFSRYLPIWKSTVEDTL